MDILSQEITRLDCDRIDLTEEVSECRFAIGEEGVMARRLQ